MVDHAPHHFPGSIVAAAPGLTGRKPQVDVEVRKVLRHRDEDALRDGAVSPRTVNKVLPVDADATLSQWLDMAHIAVEWSPDMQSLLGYPNSAITTSIQWWFERIHPDDVGMVASGLRRHLEHTDSPSTAMARLWYCEYRMMRYTEESLAPTYLLVGERMNTTRQHGHPTLSESFTFDLERRRTGHRHTEDLRDESTFRIVTENMHSGLFMMNSAGYVTFMNPAAERLTGFKYEEISKLTFHEAVHSLYPDGSSYPIHECPVYGHQVKNEAVQDAPEVFVSRDGRFFPIKYSVAPLRGGYEHGAVIEFRDVSEEKRLEQERFTALVESEQQTERVRQEEKHRKQMGEFIDYVCHEVRNPLHGIAANAAFLAEAIQQLEAASMAPISSPQLDSPTGKTRPKGLEPVLSMPDLSVLSTADQSTAKVSRRRESVSGSMPHIFSSVRAWLHAIEECASHQSDIINNVLDLSRLEAGKVQLASDVFSPWHVASQALHMVSARATERQIRLDIQAEDPSVRKTLVKGDATTIRQIFLNLLSNACKFAYRKGAVIARIGIEVDEEQGIATIRGSVTDEGVGMDDEDLKKLFQRFSQVNRRVSSEYGGSGLGLNISRELVRLLNGQLNVASQKGIGSTFSFSCEYAVPTTDESAAWHRDHPESAPSVNGFQQPPTLMADLASPADDDTLGPPERFDCIMAVEDNALNRKILAKYLSKRDTVFLACDGQEAFDRFASEEGRDIQFIVMDCEMPRLDGRQATRQIRALEAQRAAAGGEARRVPIVGLSGNARPEQVAEAKESGMDDYLSKPCSRDTLLDMISKWERIVHARRHGKK